MKSFRTTGIHLKFTQPSKFSKTMKKSQNLKHILKSMSERYGSDIKRLRILNGIPLKSDQNGNLTKTYMVHMFKKRIRTNVQISLTPFRLERFEIDLWIRNWLFTKKNYSNHKILKNCENSAKQTKI